MLPVAKSYPKESYSLPPTAASKPLTATFEAPPATPATAKPAATSPKEAPPVKGAATRPIPVASEKAPREAIPQAISATISTQFSCPA